jgi:hypothetical protein
MQLWAFFLRVMSGSVLLHRQRSREDLQQLLAWYKIHEAVELVSVCEHPNAVWLTKLFDGRDIDSCEEARQVFLGCGNDPRALSFAGCLGGRVDEVCRAAELGDAFAQACTAWQTFDEERFRWAEQSAAQGERSADLDIAFDMELDAKKMWKEQKSTFWLP